MKNLKIYLVAILLAAGTTVFANNTTPKVENKETNVTTQIAELLKNPEMEINEDIKAKVTFMVNDNKELVVINVDTKNESVDAFIKSRLNYKKLNTLKTGEEWVLPVRIVPAA
ncbi:hypothetical protein GCM10011344_30810 [Dokdonia pacifica]|uniref:TonB protein C-terminal n=1 Tax=Dokdonia pacifica TaxID=1627892 RepID=A0A239BTE4_9FLAO|nr:hypothetical protein [Dokdonia pacifica]GGG27828.1 hypothetical protein GCM10011344_30810 [Dokdonia pacifica]SNS10688.1 hypothetical protein SAMN06265376_106390 [Dokdonia pacifica]